MKRVQQLVTEKIAFQLKLLLFIHDMHWGLTQHDYQSKILKFYCSLFTAMNKFFSFLVYIAMLCRKVADLVQPE